MHDEIGAELQRTGQNRCRDRRIDHQHRPRIVRDLGGGFDVDHIPHRVRRRFDPDQTGFARSHHRLQRGERAGLGEFHINTPMHGKIIQPGADAPVHHVLNNHMGTGFQGEKRDGGCRHAGGQHHRCGPTLKPGQKILDLGPGGGIRAAIGEAARRADFPRRAFEGGRVVDRRHQGTCFAIRIPHHPREIRITVRWAVRGHRRSSVATAAVLPTINLDRLCRTSCPGMPCKKMAPHLAVPGLKEGLRGERICCVRNSPTSDPALSHVSEIGSC